MRFRGSKLDWFLYDHSRMYRRYIVIPRTRRFWS